MRVIPLPSLADDLDVILLPGLSFQPPAASLSGDDRELLRKQDWTRRRTTASHARDVEVARGWVDGHG